jgi:hypothetical protein
VGGRNSFFDLVAFYPGRDYHPTSGLISGEQFFLNVIFAHFIAFFSKTKVKLSQRMNQQG